MTDQALDDLVRRVLLDVYDQEYGDVIEELPEHDFSSAFEKKMKKLIRRADHPIRYRVAQIAACLLLAVLLSGCTVLAISPEAREAFVGWVREVSERWFVYRYTGEERPTLENMVYLPTWVPEGYEEIVSPQVGTFVRTQYENSAKELLTISYIKGTETSSLSVEWAGAVVQQTSVGHLPADLYLNPEDGPNILVWTDTKRNVAFWITAPVSEKELIKIAESIQESDPMPKRYCISPLPMNYGAYTNITETYEDGRGTAVYENAHGFTITLGYTNDAAFAPHPETESSVVYLRGTEAKFYPALEDGGDKTLLWMADDGTTLWVCSPLPDDEMLQIAGNVTVQLNRFTDLVDLQLDGPDVDGPLLEGVEQALTDSFTARIVDCAKRDAQTGNYLSEEYNKLYKDQMTQYISPEREEVIDRVSALADTLRREGRYGETIVSLFGPFYTAGIYVSRYDYDFLAANDMLDSSSTNETARQLAKELLLSDNDLLEALAKDLWIQRAKYNQECIADNKPERMLNLPKDYREIADTIKRILNGTADQINMYGDRLIPGLDASPLNHVYSALDTFLWHKAEREPLTDVERLVSKNAAQVEKYTWQTFDGQMKDIQNKINSQLGEDGFNLDIDKEYQFYLNSDFTFTVKGGTAEENARLESLLNAHPRESYKFDPLREMVMALYFSRPDSMESFN